MPLFRHLPLPAMSAIVSALMAAAGLPNGAAAAPMKLADYLALSQVVAAIEAALQAASRPQAGAYGR
jgi:hypothetical protein